MAIILTQGDDSNAMGDEIVININADIDLTGYTAIFQLADFRQEFSDITNKRLKVVIPAAVTSRLKPGRYTGGVKFIDPQGLAKTVCRNIDFSIEKEVVKHEQ